MKQTNGLLLTALDFPLNVYAWVLHLDGQAVEHLYYGLWDEDREGVNASLACKAQQRASEYLFERLPAAPKSLLEVGVGLGTTARRLEDAGYNYEGITPDSVQVLHIRHGDPEKKIHVEQTTLHEYRRPDLVDLILFQESAQYIPPMELFRYCDRLLKPGGDLMIMDEIPSGFFTKIETMLERFGFTLIQQEDLTPLAAPSPDYLVDAIRRHYPVLCHELNLSSLRLDQLIRILETRSEEYRNGSYTYQFLHFRK